MFFNEYKNAFKSWINAKIILCFFVLILISFSAFLLYKHIDAASSNITVKVLGSEQCVDGIDNDGDGYIDYPDDPGCDSYSDNDETNLAPTPTPTPTPTPGSGGGGGGGTLPTVVVFSGRAQPNSQITILKDAQIIANTIANSNSNFQINLFNINSGNYLFGLYSTDNYGRKSSLVNIPVIVVNNATANVSGIFLSPTIALDKSEVKMGDIIKIFGQSIANSKITFYVSGPKEFSFETFANNVGIYNYDLAINVLSLAEYAVKTNSTINYETSFFSENKSFLVGTKTVPVDIIGVFKKADLNGDKRINLVDYSIAVYWYDRPLSSDFARIEIERLNGDGKIDLVDFSIMAYYWTG